MSNNKVLLLKGIKSGTAIDYIYDALNQVVEVKSITSVPAFCETSTEVAIVEFYNLQETELAYQFITTLRKSSAADRCVICISSNHGCVSCRHTSNSDTTNAKDIVWGVEERNCDIELLKSVMGTSRKEYPRSIEDEKIEDHM